MFTGIVEETGTILSIVKYGDGLEFTILCNKVLKGLKIDNSISVNGVCLTIVKHSTKSFTIQAVHETLSKTNLGKLRLNDMVNLERSVRLRDRLGGHLVQGHIDCTGIVTKIEKLDKSWLFSIQYPAVYRKYIIPVGSVTVDGVSLTVARIGKSEITIAIIPYTHAHTVFGIYSKGSVVNLEFDIIGKYLESITKYS
ncbi:MAG: riboflavin synthase [Bacteroidota bacterium]|jgi:riboflavin synthase